MSLDSEISQLCDRSTVFDVKLFFFPLSTVCLQTIRIKNCLFLLKPAKSLGVAPVTVWCFFSQYKSLILTKTAQPTWAFCLELRSCERGDFVLFQVQQKHQQWERSLWQRVKCDQTPEENPIEKKEELSNAYDFEQLNLCLLKKLYSAGSQITTKLEKPILFSLVSRCVYIYIYESLW